MAQLIDNRAAGAAGVRAGTLDPAGLFDGVLWQARWAVLAGLFVLSLTYSLPGRVGVPTWALILGFAAYNALIELLRRFARLFPFTRWLALLDLPVVAALYSASSAPGGPLFVLLLLVVGCAAATMPLRASLLYTGVVMAMSAAIAPTLPLWFQSPWQIRELGAQLLVTMLVGVGVALSSRRLAREQERARTSRDEAERLAELDQLRTRFIATISHDLRTPLTAVKGGLGLIETSADARLAPNERQLLTTMRRNIARLDDYISDLLALNQLDAGVLQLDREPLDMRVLVDNCLPAVQHLVAERGHTLRLELPVALPVYGDQRRLEQVLVNLLCNAAIHTPPGTRIQVRGHTTGAETVLTVSDNGPGVPPEALPQLFDPYWQLDAASSGTGLGLAIVKGMVELHEGRVRAESAPGAGLSFQICLPQRK